jgi:DNA-directed RNA polymerase
MCLPVCLPVRVCPCVQPGLLEDLVAQLQAHHPHLEFPPIPARGDLQLHRVKNSKYFFS